MAGRLEQARTAVARLRQVNPTLRVSNLKDVLGPYRHAEDPSRNTKKDCGEPGCPNDHRSYGARPGGNVFDFRYWHETDLPPRVRHVRCQRMNRLILAVAERSEFDPKRTSVSQPRDIFQATGFCTYNAEKAPCETT